MTECAYDIKYWGHTVACKMLFVSINIKIIHWSSKAFNFSQIFLLLFLSVGLLVELRRSFRLLTNFVQVIVWGLLIVKPFFWRRCKWARLFHNCFIVCIRFASNTGEYRNFIQWRAFQQPFKRHWRFCWFFDWLFALLSTIQRFHIVVLFAVISFLSLF